MPLRKQTRIIVVGALLERRLGRSVVVSVGMRGHRLQILKAMIMQEMSRNSKATQPVESKTRTYHGRGGVGQRTAGRRGEAEPGGAVHKGRGSGGLSRG